MNDSVKERLARIEESQEAGRREIHALFDLHNTQIVPAISKINGMEKQVDSIVKEVASHKKSHWQPFLALAAGLAALGAFFEFGQKIMGRVFNGGS